MERKRNEELKTNIWAYKLIASKSDVWANVFLSLRREENANV
jgi:hypothetical protein